MSSGPRTGLRSRKAFVAVIVVILLAGAWATVRSPVFAVREILVAGHAPLPRARLVRLSGVRHGDNLVLDVSADEIRARLEASPWVAQADVERRLPSTLVLTIRERVAAGWVGDPGGGAVVSRDGTVLERPGRRPPGLPGVGTAPRALPPGAAVAGMGAVLLVAGSLPPDLRAEVSAVRRDGADVVLRLRGGARVLYGPPSSLRAKNAAVRSMLAWAAERDVAIGYIDVRVPDAPVLRAATPG
ncbi:MAG TPA: FtsQ-type POTRA domain-containing protein [Actinomycetota bacterium]|nr:FtsQ-type POTRA domain-containing protein [Actinomycetota bacterium]